MQVHSLDQEDYLEVCLENPMDWGAWSAAVHGVAKSRAWLKQFSKSAFSYSYIHTVPIHAFFIPLSMAGITYLWQLVNLQWHFIISQSPHLLQSSLSRLYAVASVVSNSVRPHRWQPNRLSHPWDSPGKNTGVGCHFLLQCMQVKSESEVAQSCPTLRNPIDCSLPGSSIHGIFQARVLEWGAIAFSWGCILLTNCWNHIASKIQLSFCCCISYTS